MDGTSVKSTQIRFAVDPDEKDEFYERCHARNLNGSAIFRNLMRDYLEQWRAEDAQQNAMRRALDQDAQREAT